MKEKETGRGKVRIPIAMGEFLLSPIPYKSHLIDNGAKLPSKYINEILMSSFSFIQHLFVVAFQQALSSSDFSLSLALIP